MKILCICLTLALSSCASLDQWAKNAFEPPPLKMSSFYVLGEDGSYSIREGYRYDFAADCGSCQEATITHCECCHEHDPCD